MSHLLGRIELVETGPDFAIVHGWVVARDAAPAPAGLSLVIGGGTPTPITDFFSRPDLIAAGVASGPAAFRQELTFAGDSLGRLSGAFQAESGEVLLTFADVPTRRFMPLGSIDSAGFNGIRGWVLNPATWRSGAGNALQIDGRWLVPITLDLERLDVNDSMNHRGQPLGFNVPYRDVLDAVQAQGGAAAIDGEEHDIALVSGDVVVAARTMTLLRRARGYLEHFRNGKLTGWAVLEDQPETPATVQVNIDGVPYGRVTASRPRTDLKEKGVSQTCGGFSLRLLSSPTGQPDVEISAGVVGSRGELGGQLKTLTGLQTPVYRPEWPRILDESGFRERAVSVVVPVYNAPDELDACLASLIAHTTLPCRIFVVDDASPDPRVAEVLARYEGVPGLHIVRNDLNRGFSNTCNRGIELAGTDDVVLLNSDTTVGDRWLQNLKLAAYSRRRVATATPMSDNAGVFSVPDINQPNPWPAGLDHAAVARLAMQTSAASFPTVVTGHGFCLYLRRTALDELGWLDAEAFPRGYGEENDFCSRARRAGYLNVMDDRTHVHHVRSASFLGEKPANYEAGQTVLHARFPEYKLLTREFDTDSALLNVRWRMRKAMQQATRPPKPRVLFVISTESGGTPQTNRDLMAALSDRYEPWLLQCDSQTVSLYDASVEGAPSLRERCALMRPIAISDHRSEEYNAFVANVLVQLGIELVHVRHVAWHSLDLLEICRSLSIPLVFSFHDFYAICPTIKLIDSQCQGCCLGETRTEAPCTAELWEAATVPPLKPGFIDHWRQMFAKALPAAAAFVTTSPGARDRLVQAFPFLAERDFRVIPHGRDFQRLRAIGSPPAPGEPLKVLVPGNISPAKGALLIRDIAELDGGATIEFHILGDHGVLTAQPGIVVHGRYERERFGERVRGIEPHIGAVLSLWPETYCHTLTEMWASGLPVVALGLGAVRERIERHGGGWLVPAGSTPAAVLEVFTQIASDDADIRQKTQDVLRWQSAYGRTYGTAMMAASYDRLYRDAWRAQAAFAPAEPRDLPVWAVTPDQGIDRAMLNRPQAADVCVPFVSVPDASLPEFAGLAGCIAVLRGTALDRKTLSELAADTSGKPIVLDARALPAGLPAHMADSVRARIAVVVRAPEAGPEDDADGFPTVRAAADIPFCELPRFIPRPHFQVETAAAAAE